MFHQTLGQLLETGAQHLAHRRIGIDPRFGQGIIQLINLITAATPEGQLADMVQQGRNKHLFLMLAQHIAGDVARLHRGMKGARQQLGQLIARPRREQAIDQADRQTDQTNALKADQHDGPGNGANILTGRVVVDCCWPTRSTLAVSDASRSNTVRQLLHRGLFGTGDQLLHIGDDRGQRRQFRIIQPINPCLCKP